MVSKLIKRTPTKSIKDSRSASRRRHHRKSPAKKAAVAVLASIHKRLVKFFSKLARIATPNRSASKGYKILKKSTPSEPEKAPSVCRSLDFGGDRSRRRVLLPPPASGERRTVFLDLDETLVHSKADPPPQRFDFMVRPRIDGEAMSFYVLKRPGLDELLASLAEAGYEVVVFTAGLREYASQVIDRIDRNHVVAHRLYRDACTEVDGRLVKDLSASGRDLSRAVIVDDNPNSYSLQPENAVPVRPFVDDLGDRELGRLIGFFKGLDQFEDMRDGVKDYLARQNDKLDDATTNVNTDHVNNTLSQ